MYEIGALCALDEALEGLDFNRLQHYVGVSAGGFVAAALANGITPRQLCSGFIEDDGKAGDVFDPAWLMVPAYREFVRRGAMVPLLAASALWRATLGGKSLFNALGRLGAGLPTGIFSGEQIDARLAQLFSQPGRTNDFRRLKSRLTLVATDLDTGEAVPFGRPGWDHVTISRAVQASSALPGLFPPVEIDARHFVDGALKKTLHASVALDEGVDLMLCLNPLVPFHAGAAAIPRIADGGLPTVLSQTFRSLIHSRMALGIRHYQRAYPKTDIVLIEPDHRDPELYLANPFSYGQRRHLAEHAYQQTRALLRRQSSVLSGKFARHGIRLRREALQDGRRRLLATTTPPGRVSEAMVTLHHTLDDLGRALRRELRAAS